MTLLYTCSNLPTGASLASSGRLIVLPTAAAGTTALSITITDSVTGDVGSGTVSLVVSSLVTAAYFGLQLPISLSASFELTASVAVAAQTLSVIDIALTAGVSVLQQAAMQANFALTATVRYSAAGLPVDFALTATSAPASFSTALASIRSSAGMTQIVSAYSDDANIVLPTPSFAMPVYGGSYQSNIFIGSNSYLTFGYSTSVFSGLSLTVPGLALMLAAADRSWLSVYVNQDSAKSYRILWNGGASSGGTSPYSWQVVLWADGTIELAYDAAFPTAGVKALTKGDGIASSSFTTTAGVAGSYVFTPVDAATSSYTVQAGSYVSNAPAAPITALAGSASQPQVLGGSLSNVSPGLAGSVSQPQTLAGSLAVGKLLAGSVSQPQTLAGSAAVSSLLAGSASQPQALNGRLSSFPAGMSSGIIQPQALAGDLSVTPPLQSETAFWVSRVQGLGGQPTTTGTAAVDAFFVAIKSQSYYSKLKLLHLLAGTTTIASAMAPLLHPASTAATLSGFSSSDYTASGSGAGIQGNGTGYVDHSYSPFSSSPGFDAAIGTYSKTTASFDGYDVGYVASSSERLEIIVRYSNGSLFADAFDQGDGRIAVTAPVVVGLAVASRISASDFRSYFNGAQTAIDTLTVATMPSTVNKFYSFYGGLSSGFSPSTRKLAFSFAATGLTPTEVSAFSAAVSTLIGAI